MLRISLMYFTEEDDVISDDEKSPEEIAAAELRANRRRGYDPNSSLDGNNTSFLSGVGSSVSSTPSLERDLSSTQQVVYRKEMIGKGRIEVKCMRKGKAIGS